MPNTANVSIDGPLNAFSARPRHCLPLGNHHSDIGIYRNRDTAEC